jgi:hypothetical protein
MTARMFGNNSDSVVAERKLGLEKYLNLLVKVCDPAHHSSASPSKVYMCILIDRKIER